MAKILVTGGAGFIGSHVVDRLISEGNTVTVYDNLSSGRKEFIKQHLGKKYFNFIKADLLDADEVKKSVAGHDIVYHLAANPDAAYGMVETDLDLKQNTQATYNILEAMRVNDVREIVFSSSGTIYGDVGVTPTPEDFGPLLPISLYGASKVACETLISAFCHTFDMHSWIYRFANIVGGRATHGVIYDFTRKLMENPKELEILGDGKQSKPYLFVDECVDGMLFGYNYAKERVNVFNLGVEDYLDVKSIADIVVEEMGLKDVEYKYTGGDRGWKGDVPQVRFNVDKMRKLGWQAKSTSEEAVRKTVKCLLTEYGI